MTILQTGVSLPLNLKAGETLVIKELSGTSTVTGSVASREDASASIGAGFVAYGPQSSDCSVTISTTGVCDWSVVVGDETPTTDVIKTLKTASGQFVLDEPSKAALNVSGYGQIADRLISSVSSARNNSPLDLAVMSSPPVVTVGAAAITNGRAFNYFDTDGHKRIRIKGVPFGDSSVMCENAAGYLRGVNVGNSGGNFAVANNAKHYLCEVTFTGQIIQFVLNGLSAGLIRFRVNGQLVSASATTVGNSNVQLDFGATVYNKTIAMEFEQAQTVKGVVVGPNDTIYAVDTPPVPLVVTGDSYVQGITSPVTFGAETFCGCLRDVSGLNVLALGVASAGYIKSGFVNMTNSQWLGKIIAATNAANAPVILIPFGTNDYGLDASAVQSAAASVGRTLLGGTSAKVVFMGPWPQNRNNDAGSLAIESAIQSAASSLDQTRVGFIPVCSGSNPWVQGQGDNDTAPNGTTIAYGNSAIVTGNDGVHPFPGRGSEYLARRTIDALISVCQAKGW